ncbi:uncharacterized protein LOC141668165 [Apium graveolens]|uniref:uncharacterized protein LOC141668165 n=1 Tax=Apium graveolens TaxID=4045 RepID=UPI003D7946E5
MVLLEKNCSVDVDYIWFKGVAHVSYHIAPFTPSLFPREHGGVHIKFGKHKERATVETEVQADLPTIAGIIAEEEVMNASTKIPTEVARKEREVDECTTLDGPRKSGRQTRGTYMAQRLS